MVRSDKAIRFESQIENCQKKFGFSKSSCNTKKNLNNPTWDILLLHLMIIAKEKTGKIHWNMTIRPGPTPLLLHNTTWRIYYTSYIACFPKIHSHAENSTFSYTLCYQCCNFVCNDKNY